MSNPPTGNADKSNRPGDPKPAPQQQQGQADKVQQQQGGPAPAPAQLGDPPPSGDAKR
jgi:hypothetical protein